MHYWLGFRQVLLKSGSGVIDAPGAAVVCGPFASFSEAEAKRARGMSDEWDAVYSAPFQAIDAQEANSIVEAKTPTSRG